MQCKIGMLTLGCAKNRVDAEIMLASLRSAGYKIVEDIECCDIAIVNTCGFIDDAKRESIEEILDLVRLKEEGTIKSIIITGCLAERYQKEVMLEIPEVDAVVGIGGNIDIVSVIERVLSGKKIELFPSKEKFCLEGDRVRTTPNFYSYLKIADGCDNCCTYCAIPLIRGRFRSRKMEDIIEEAKKLAKSGVKELIVIAQDTTRYGEDIYGKLMLAQLLKELCKIEGISWIRILYCYPDRITDELLDVIASEEKILKYIDLPLQHCNSKILKSMNRRSNKEELECLIDKIRNKIPNVIIRTTFIVGFPNETDKEFEELLDFVKEIKFDRMGCFAYSKEEDTPAALMENQVDDEIKLRRQEIIMEEQMKIMEEMANKLVGKTITVLVEEFSKENNYWVGRSKADSPDVDGKVIFSCKGASPGDFVNVKIKSFTECDLVGEQVL